MIDAHPQLAVAPETHFVVSHLVPHTSYSLEQSRERLSRDARFVRLGLNERNVFEPFASGGRSFSQASLFLEMLRQYAAARQASIIGDKAPKNIEHLSVLKELVSDAYVIHLIRDPRDVYLSRVKAKWSAGRSEMLQHLAYRAQIQMGREEGPRLFGDRYLELRYERLITDPRGELTKIASFLEVTFDEAMLEFSISGKRLVADDEKDWKGNVSGPLLTNNMNKWRRQMTLDHVRKVEAACWPVFAEGLYQQAERGRTLGARGRLTDVFYSLLSSLYRLKIARVNQRCIRTIRRQFQSQRDAKAA
jgi:hypothetical protein